MQKLSIKVEVNIFFAFVVKNRNFLKSMDSFVWRIV